MLADIRQVDHGYIARFERQLKHTVEQVWSALTENDLLAQWFPELRVDDLREGGVITFDMQDGTFAWMSSACYWMERGWNRVSMNGKHGMKNMYS